MRTRVMGLVMAALLMAPAAPAAASVVFDQINDDRSRFEVGLGTQRFEAAYAAQYDWAGVDDFTLTQATHLTAITANFLGFNGFTTPDNILSYGVEFYSAPEMANVSLTGDVASFTLTPDQVSVGALFPLPNIGDDAFGFQVRGPLDLTLAAGTYWLAMIPRMDVETGGQTSTMAWDDGSGATVFHANPGQADGVEDWHGFRLQLRLEGEAAAVPEPAEWVLLTVGFGLSGAVLRRRRRTALA